MVVQGMTGLTMESSHFLCNVILACFDHINDTTLSHENASMVVALFFGLEAGMGAYL